MSDPSSRQPQDKVARSSRKPVDGRVENHEPILMSNDEPNGINLTLVYSLIALALFAAIGFALLIVLPFYHRR